MEVFRWPKLIFLEKPNFLSALCSACALGMPPVLGCCGDIEVSGGDSRCVPMVQALVASACPAQSIRTSVHPFKLCIMGLCQQRLYFLPRPDMLMRHSDRAYLRRCERKQQREMEGKASFWKHENF